MRTSLNTMAASGWLYTICLFQVLVITILASVVYLDRAPVVWNSGAYVPPNFQQEVVINRSAASSASSAVARANEQAKELMDLWSQSLELNNQNPALPRAPHFQDCKKRSQEIAKLDSRGSNGEWPRWTQWKGALGLELGGNVRYDDHGEEMLLDSKATVEGPYPPWVQGADEDNLAMTRRVQRDIWLHQHPRNCSSAKFLLPEWQSIVNPGGFGVGAEMVALAGWLAIAIKENRILVTKDYHGAKHEGCKGSSHSRWSCYFVPEASQECIDRAMQLAKVESAWKSGLITTNKNYPSSVCLTNFGVPELWGKPWESTQRTAVVYGELLDDKHVANPENRRWWRAQAFKYLMRFPSENLCKLLNKARHDAFGKEAAELVASRLPAEWPKANSTFWNSTKQSPIERLVWSTEGPWIPRPMVSLHVRQGDKAREMEILGFQDYMKLCEQLRNAKPHVRDIWLATEMQTVIEESSVYGRAWNFYYTMIKRQKGTTTMSDYMASLGKQNCFDNSFVNLMMAADSDYFVGALGSTWSCLIDSLRMTSGKTMAGFLSVNPMNMYL